MTTRESAGSQWAGAVCLDLSWPWLACVEVGAGGCWRWWRSISGSYQSLFTASQPAAPAWSSIFPKIVFIKLSPGVLIARSGAPSNYVEQKLESFFSGFIDPLW